MSSASESAGLVTLNVDTQDEGTEIFVVDSRMKLVASGHHDLTTQLPAGIYKLRVMTGGKTHEELVTLRDPSKPVHRPIPRLSFCSPVPLTDTANTHEYHMGLAQSVSASALPVAGTESSFFIMARCWTPDRLRSQRVVPLKPLTWGLSLLQPDGQPVVDLNSIARVHQVEGDDPAAACALKLKPGIYMLDRRLPSGDHVVRTIVASPGWQTQVFLMDSVDEAEEEQLRDAGTAVLLSRSPFDPADDSVRLDEIARLALTDARQVLSAYRAYELLVGKFRNPMLGILGAHLLLQRRWPDPEASRRNLETLDLPKWEVESRMRKLDASAQLHEAVKISFSNVIKNLRRLLGDEHPDVEALALKGIGPASSYRFLYPPMLRQSWGMVLEATVTHPELVPSGSLAEKISDRLLTELPWLLWIDRAESPAAEADLEALSPTAYRGAAEDISPSLTEEALERLLRPRERSRGATRGFESTGGPESFSPQGLFPPPEHSVSNPDEPEMRRLVRTLGVPRQRIEEMLRNKGLRP